MSNKVRHYDSIQYEILQIIPANGASAVFAEDDGSSNEKLCLAKYAINLLALAKVTTQEFAYSETGGEHKIGSPRVRNHIVGIVCIEGEFGICDSFHNFAGYHFDGDDINNCVSHLTGNMLQKLSTPIQEGA